VGCRNTLDDRPRARGMTLARADTSNRIQMQLFRRIPHSLSLSLSLSLSPTWPSALISRLSNRICANFAHQASGPRFRVRSRVDSDQSNRYLVRAIPEKVLCWKKLNDSAYFSNLISFQPRNQSRFQLESRIADTSIRPCARFNDLYAVFCRIYRISRS